MGGDIAIHFAAKYAHVMRGFINIEGNLTHLDVVISRQAVNVAERGHFEKWFRENFMEQMVLNDWGVKWVACRRYYASLWFCDQNAFLSSARAVCEHNSADRKQKPGRNFYWLTCLKFIAGVVGFLNKQGS